MGRRLVSLWTRMSERIHVIRHRVEVLLTKERVTAWRRLAGSDEEDDGCDELHGDQGACAMR